MDRADLPYLIALTQVPNIGPITAKTLISYAGSAAEIFKLPARKLVKIPDIGEFTASLIKQQTDPHQTGEEVLVTLEQHHIRPVTFFDEAYPFRLKQIHESPIILYVKGEANLNTPRMISVVGTRKPSAAGLAFCEQLIAELKPYQPTIISGLAYGVDICAHKQALLHELPTIAVLGHGLDRLYPATHAQVAQKIIQNQGALISEFNFGAEIEKENFALRNRLVAGMADALVVVESAQKGGSMITAAFANAYDRDVLAVPGRPGEEKSAGCNWLIKHHQAALLDNTLDLVNVLGWDTEIKVTGVQTSLFSELSADEQKVLDLIKAQPNIDIDQLSFLAKINLSDLSTCLLQLEFNSLIKSLPGKRFLAK